MLLNYTAHIHVQELCLVGDTTYAEVGSLIQRYQPEELNQQVYEPGCVTYIL